MASPSTQLLKLKAWNHSGHSRLPLLYIQWPKFRQLHRPNLSQMGLFLEPAPPPRPRISCVDDCGSNPSPRPPSAAHSPPPLDYVPKQH